MAHKKAQGSTANLRDSKPKYRGVKIFGGQQTLAGGILVRQKGWEYEPGMNVFAGKDYTLHAQTDGVVQFRKKKIMRFDGRVYLKTFVDVVGA